MTIETKYNLGDTVLDIFGDYLNENIIKQLLKEYQNDVANL